LFPGERQLLEVFFQILPAFAAGENVLKTQNERLIAPFVITGRMNRVIETHTIVNIPSPLL
jgi:hypothetical protein